MQDDAEAFALLVARWQAPLCRLCARMLGDTHRAEDLTQEAFTKLFASRSRYQPSARFSTYLWQIGLNLCRDELRKRGRNREDSVAPDEVEVLLEESSLSPDAGSSPDTLISAEERALQVQAALAQLPGSYREVLILRHYEGLKFREIAEVLEIPEGTVKSRMVEALNRMASLLHGARAPGCGDRIRDEHFVL